MTAEVYPFERRHYLPFRKGKLQQPFFSKYTWKMAFVLSRFAAQLQEHLCEAKDVGYSCDFSKNSPRDFGTTLIGLYIT